MGKFFIKLPANGFLIIFQWIISSISIILPPKQLVSAKYVLVLLLSAALALAGGLAQGIRAVWTGGFDLPSVLGGAGAFDVVVISGLLAVLLSELIGELIERATRGNHKPALEFKDGDFVRKEHRK